MWIAIIVTVIIILCVLGLHQHYSMTRVPSPEPTRQCKQCDKIKPISDFRDDWDCPFVVDICIKCECKNDYEHWLLERERDAEEEHERMRPVRAAEKLADEAEKIRKIMEKNSETSNI